MGFLVACLAAAALVGGASSSSGHAGADAGRGAPLLREVEAALGASQRRAIEGHLPETREALRPLFAAMQKTGDQKLGPAAARYVLHRFFMQRGWLLRDLAAAGGASGARSPIKILRDRMPGQAQRLLEGQLGGAGAGLDELAALAATLTHLVRGDATDQLRSAYRLHGVPTDEALTKEQMQRVMDTFQMGVVLGTDLSTVDPREFAGAAENMHSIYVPWARIRKAAEDLGAGIFRGGAHTFPGARRLAEGIFDQLGSWNNEECLRRKRELVALEDRPDSGRVRLSEFYRASLHGGKWYFGENTGYLRQLGALDDTRPDDLRVIIPNWVTGVSNCMDASKYVSFCCLNECDGILARFEGEVGGPSATPARIAAIAAAVPSESVPANRTLPAPLARRLGEIAEIHGGQVPLHGRLFGQWLHHAYPRECPFPHVSGTTSPMQAGDWERATGSEVIATAEEMTQHIEAARPRRPDASGEDAGGAPWTEEEELLEPLLQRAREPMPEASAGLTLTYAAILVAFTTGIAKLAKSSFPVMTGAGDCSGKPPVYFI